MGNSALTDDAITAIRDLLNNANVPSTAYIDDHVGNAIAQRNILADALTQIRGWREIGNADTPSEKLAAIEKIADAAFAAAQIKDA